MSGRICHIDHRGASRRQRPDSNFGASHVSKMAADESARGQSINTMLTPPRHVYPAVYPILPCELHRPRRFNKNPTSTRITTPRLCGGLKVPVSPPSRSKMAASF
ncbi:uncharacterized protein LOC105700946 [Orussus abietinus]|uniref:uncharacterized protein LOC105700946 n=1 Tax=Orussus abietinus TaxID=222816 RepID=UPI0006269A2C|nr:uncharacterized protein LOC105700946 [Orussus abietinus]